jgi:hypothetical protein
MGYLLLDDFLDAGLVLGLPRLEGFDVGLRDEFCLFGEGRDDSILVDEVSVVIVVVLPFRTRTLLLGFSRFSWLSLPLCIKPSVLSCTGTSTFTSASPSINQSNNVDLTHRHT